MLDTDAHKAPEERDGVFGNELLERDEEGGLDGKGSRDRRGAVDWPRLETERKH